MLGGALNICKLMRTRTLFVGTAAVRLLNKYMKIGSSKCVGGAARRGDLRAGPRLANYAGGLVVMKRSTATVTAAELRRAVTADLRRDAAPPMTRAPGPRRRGALIAVPGPGYFVAIILLVFLSFAICTWMVRKTARSQGWLAPTRPDRWHREPTALFGGVGIFAAFVTGVVALVPWTAATGGLVALTTIMFAIGLYDDARELKPQTKVVAQIISALLLYVFGFHFNDASPGGSTSPSWSSGSWRSPTR